MNWPRTAAEAERFKRRLSIAWGAGVAIATAWAAIVGALISYNRIGWSPWTALVPLIAAGIATAAQTIWALWREKRRPKEHEYLESLRQVAAIGVKGIRDITNLPLERIGACVWEVVSYPLILREPRLRRLVRFRIDPFPAPSDVDWKMGKGAIGICWETKRKKYMPWRAVAKKWVGKEVTDAGWDSMKPGPRAGFERTEFSDIVTKYAEILAMPIKHPATGVVIGVLSFDLPVDADANAGDMLDGHVVELEAENTASLLASLMRES